MVTSALWDIESRELGILEHHGRGGGANVPSGLLSNSRDSTSHKAQVTIL